MSVNAKASSAQPLRQASRVAASALAIASVLLVSASEAVTYADRPMVFATNGALLSTRSLPFNRYAVVRRSGTNGDVLNEYAFGPEVEVIAYAPRVERIAAIGSGRFAIWELDGSKVASGACHIEASAHDVHFSANGRFLVIAYHSGSVETRDANSGAYLDSVSIPCDGILSSCVDDSGQWALALGLESAYRIDFSRSSYREIAKVADPALCLLDDGKWAAVNQLIHGRSQLALFALSESLSEDANLCAPTDLRAFSTADSGVFCLQEISGNDSDPAMPIVNLRPNCTLSTHAYPSIPANVLAIHRVSLARDGLTAGYASPFGRVTLIDLERGTHRELPSLDAGPIFSQLPMGGAIVLLLALCSVALYAMKKGVKPGLK